MKKYFPFLLFWMVASFSLEGQNFYQLGTDIAATDCEGLLFDNGGPDSIYTGGVEESFTVCPSNPTACIDIEIIDYSIDPYRLFFGGDVLSIYAGNNAVGDPIGIVSGSGTLAPLKLKVNDPCFTVVFTADEQIEMDGFQLKWSCNAEECGGSGSFDPIEITELPFSAGPISTCDGYGSLTSTVCGLEGFLWGQEMVFKYIAPGGVCADINLTGALSNTGMAILKGDPQSTNSICVAQTETGILRSVNFEEPGEYYIIVANGTTCTPFNIEITPVDCRIPSGLSAALCNPVNGCSDGSGQPIVYEYQAGFEDLDIREGVNNGCWQGAGFQPNYYWFTVQAAIDGKLGFSLQSAGYESDLDFNVWGPFANEEVCEQSDDIIDFIQNNAPVRSSYADLNGPTGLSATHPITGQPIKDELDCENEVEDGWVSPIDASIGEVYVILVNDWGGEIEKLGLEIDWSPSDRGIIDQIPLTIVRGETTICSGGRANLLVESPDGDITWTDPNNSLSCTDCPNPVARPTETTTYKVEVAALCYREEKEITVYVYDLIDAEDQTVCLGSSFTINDGYQVTGGTFNWTAQNGINLSCEDCAQPIITADSVGTFLITGTLDGPGCDFQTAFRVTVLPEMAPVHQELEDVEVCAGDEISLGNPAVEGQTYQWTNQSGNFTSAEANPTIIASGEEWYYLSIDNGLCEQPTLDSLKVTTITKPVLNVEEQMEVCQNNTVILGNTTPENNVQYRWRGLEDVDAPNLPNSTLTATTSGTYTLIATRGGCEVETQIDIEVVPISLDITLGAPNLESFDTLLMCKGTSNALFYEVTPANLSVVWESSNGIFTNQTSSSVNLGNASGQFTVYAQTSNQQCNLIDSLVVIVDSLPENLIITPIDTSICEGAFAVLRTPSYEPAEFPGMTFKWYPSRGLETPDSLLSMVVTPDTTTQYYRVVENGACLDTSLATVTVNPLPTLSIIPNDSTVCPGDPIRLTLQKEEPGNLEEIEWNPETGLSCTNCLSPTAQVQASTTYKVEAKLKECPGEASVNVLVIPSPQFKFPEETVICPGTSILLNSVFSAGASYTWTSTDPDFGIVTAPRPVVTPSETTTYYLSVSNGQCDPINRSVTIEVVGEVTVDVEASRDRICEGESVELKANITGGSSQDNFVWVNDRGLTFEGQNITVFPPQTTTYTLNYTSGGDCQQIQRSVTITVDPSVDVTIKTDAPATILPQGSVVNLEAMVVSNALGNIQINWTGNGVNLGSGEAISTTLIENPASFEVTAATPAGCTDADTIVFEIIQPSIEIPNAFTPNGDGNNDYFNVLYSGQIDEILEFQIRNRWGKLVYNNENQLEGWDGNLNGKPQPTEVYVYLLKIKLLDGELVQRQGDVTLIR